MKGSAFAITLITNQEWKSVGDRLKFKYLPNPFLLILNTALAFNANSLHIQNYAFMNRFSLHFVKCTTHSEDLNEICILCRAHVTIKHKIYKSLSLAYGNEPIEPMAHVLSTGSAMTRSGKFRKTDFLNSANSARIRQRDGTALQHICFQGVLLFYL